MVELHIENIGKHHRIRFQNKIFDALDDARGVREKFWIVDNNCSQQTTNGSKMLFKFNRNNVSCENWG